MPSPTSSGDPGPALAVPSSPGVTAYAPDVDDDQLAAEAEVLVDAMRRAADVAVIGVASWWPRLTSALVTAAESAECPRAVVAEMARKLQVEVLSPEAGQVAADFAVRLSDPGVFARWAALAARDAVFHVAMVRVRTLEARERAQEARAAKSAKPDTEKASPMPAPVEMMEPMF